MALVSASSLRTRGGPDNPPDWHWVVHLHAGRFSNGVPTPSETGPKDSRRHCWGQLARREAWRRSKYATRTLAPGAERKSPAGANQRGKALCRRPLAATVAGGRKGRARGAAPD